ncbi:MAG: hypothetical protein ACREU7_08055 [Burkholderiales bacterium]
MTQVSNASISWNRGFVTPSWFKTLLARLLGFGPRRIGTVDPERWSRHMLRDIGLSE